MCSLNEILNVDFEETTYYFGLTADQKEEVQQKMIKYLLQELFPNKWLIAVDSAEQMDDQSWKMIDYVINLDFVPLVIVIGSIWKPSEYCKNTLTNPRIQTIVLGEIDKSFHSSLICQMLGVEAIPLDLEK